jgi:hypothetical protein
VHSLISARRPLGGAVEAFEEARRAGVLKVLVEPERRR